MRMFARILAALAVSVAFQQANAFPNGAGGLCEPSIPAVFGVGSPHATDTTVTFASLEDYGLQVQLNGVPIVEDTENLFHDGSEQVLSVVSTLGDPFKGILMRIESVFLEDVSDALTAVNETVLQVAQACAATGGIGLTHRNSDEKQRVDSTLSYASTDADDALVLDVTVVVETTEWYYSTYFLVPRQLSTKFPSPPPISSSVAPTTEPSVLLSQSPSKTPSFAPLQDTGAPSLRLSFSPTSALSEQPVAAISLTPVAAVSALPSSLPSSSTSLFPTDPLVSSYAPVLDTGFPSELPSTIPVSDATILPSLLPSDHTLLGPIPDVIALNYTHEGDSLTGYLSLPVNATDTDKKPAVVIIPDWNGNNYYEQQRATMVATDLGYVGFAADIYGSEFLNVEGSLRGQLAGIYRGNSTLFAGRIQAAVDFVKTMPEVDVDNVAVAGYCFGGTGVLTYALLGLSDVKAVVSFHGGLTSLPEVGPAVVPKVLVLSGGDDDTATEITDLEDTLNSANATWEITRYSGILHAFTVFNDARYNEFADTRSWESMRHFLKECFNETEFEVSKPDTFSVEAVPYVDETDGAELLSYVAFPNDEWNTTQPVPCIVIIPNWDGVNDYEKERAQLLANHGYVGFAADIYGADLQEDLSVDVRLEQAGLYRGNMTLFVSRMQRAVDEVKTFEQCDAENIAVIGYCFGGTGVVQYAFSGRDDVKAVVSFHGNTQEQYIPRVVETIRPYTLVLSGGEDDAHGNQTFLEERLNAGEADWEITRYSGVFHGFTEWEDDRFNLNADVRSFESMITIFEEFMPLPSRATFSFEEESVSSLPSQSPSQEPTYYSLCPRTEPCMGFQDEIGISLILAEGDECENVCAASWFLQQLLLGRGWQCGVCE